MAAKKRSKRPSAKPTKRPSATKRSTASPKKRAKTGGGVKGGAVLVAATSAAAVSAHEPTTAALVVLFGVLGTALAVGSTLALEALKPVAAAFAARMVSRFASNGDAGEAARKITKRVTASRGAQRAVLEGMRRLLDSISDAAAEPLADLTSEYLEQGKAPDGFFRGTARLLSDLTTEEIGALREILARVATDDVILDRDDVVFLYRVPFAAKGTDGPAHLQFSRPIHFEDGRRSSSEWADLGPLSTAAREHGPRALQQLLLNGLTELQSGGTFGASGTDIFNMKAETVRRLARLLPVPARTVPRDES